MYTIIFLEIQDIREPHIHTYNRMSDQLCENMTVTYNLFGWKSGVPLASCVTAQRSKEAVEELLCGGAGAKADIGHGDRSPSCSATGRQVMG